MPITLVTKNGFDQKNRSHLVSRRFGNVLIFFAGLIGLFIVGFIESISGWAQDSNPSMFIKILNFIEALTYLTGLAGLYFICHGKRKKAFICFGIALLGLILAYIN